MTEPTKDIIAQALSNAAELLHRNKDWTLERALAEATTTAQCRGFMGFEVYAGVLRAVEKSEGLNRAGRAELAYKATGKRAHDVLDKAIKEVQQ